MDLEAITPSGTEPSIEASLQWLGNRKDQKWILLFDNADDVTLNLGEFFPLSRSGNILVTTRNRDMCRHTTERAST